MKKLLNLFTALTLLFGPSVAFAQAARPIYETPLPTLSTGQSTALHTDVNGRLQASGATVASSLPTLTNGNPATLYVDTSGELYITGFVTATAGGTYTVQSQTTGSNTTATKDTATAAVSSGVLTASVNQPIYGINVVSGASAGFVLILEGTSIPADGAVTPNECFSLAANSTFFIDYGTFPVRPVTSTNKLIIVFSTTGCYTKTASATAFISYRF